MLLVNPVLMAVVTSCGMIACHLAGSPSHGHEVFLANLIFIFSSEAAVTIAVWQKPAKPLDAAQAALVAMGLHLFLSIVLSIGVMLVVKPGHAYVWWALALYWTTLTGVGFVLIYMMRQSAQISKTQTIDRVF